MTKVAFAAVAAATLLTSTTAFARGPGDTPAAENADEHACFAMGRAGFASSDSEYSNGYYISQRKGDNPEINADWIEQNCTVAED